MKRKLIYIISDVDKALAFEWTALYLKENFNLIYILIGKDETVLKKYVTKIGVENFLISDDQYPGFVKKAFRLLTILNTERPDIVHTHLWRANLLGLSIAWVLGVKKRIFTRHHATIHYDEYPSGRKWDRLCNFMATDIIAISDNIRKILIEMDKADARKVQLIHHGFDLDYFSIHKDEHIQSLRLKYNLPVNSFPVIGVISRFVEWKGVQYIIPAFKKIRSKYPEAKLILANATGDYEHELQLLLDSLPEAAYLRIQFETDLASLYSLFDVFVHTPVDKSSEAFGQTYVEALASHVPSVFTLSGIAAEFINDKRNALVVNFKDSDAIESAIHELLVNTPLRKEVQQNGLMDVQRFSFDNHIHVLRNLYAVKK